MAKTRRHAGERSRNLQGYLFQSKSAACLVERRDDGDVPKVLGGREHTQCRP